MKGEIWLLISQYNGKTRFGEGINLEMATTSANIYRSAQGLIIRLLEHIRKTCSQQIQGEKLKNLSAVFERKEKIKVGVIWHPLTSLCAGSWGNSFTITIINYKLSSG